MRILFLSSRLPHATVAGGHMIIHQRIVRLVKRGHEVGLASFCDQREQERADSLRDILLELELVETPPPREGIRRVADCLFSEVPLQYVPLRSAEMSRVAGNMVHRTGYDAVVSEFSGMGQHLYHNPYLPAVRRIISCHHSPTMGSRKSLELLGPSPRALCEWLRARGLSRYEFNMYRSVDQVLVLTPQERYWLLNYAPNLRIAVVPSGVDDEYFKPSGQDSAEPAILFTGHYTDEPNRDAVMWFAAHVWPGLREKHPELKFYVVGPEPTYEMRHLGEKDPRIIVTGRVDDLRPYFARAKVFVCPVRMGSGMRGKILEAMAAGVAVVSTTLGVEGIPVQVGDNCFLADRPDIMAESIELLLTDVTLRTAVVQRAHTMVTERFSWERSITMFENILDEVMSGR